MPETFNPTVLLAYNRARERAAAARADRALARLGTPARQDRGTYSAGDPRLTDGLTAEEIERDARSIRHIISIWRRIGKTTPSPITLPSGRTILPKRSPQGQRAARAEKRPRRGVSK